MTDKDTAEMIGQCIQEFESLRNQVASLQPKAEAYDSIAKILNLLPQREQGYGVDIVWQLKKELSELQPKVAEAGA